MGEQNKLMAGVWAIVLTGDTRGVLGRLKQHKTLSQEARTAIYSSKVLIMDLAFDYFCPPSRSPAVAKDGRPVMVEGRPQFVWSREPVLMGLGFTLDRTDVAVAGWQYIYFLDDLSPEDRKTHDYFIEAVVENNTKQRAERSDIQLASSIEEAVAAGKGGPNGEGLRIDMRDIRKQR